MKEKMINQVNLEGILYNHELEERVTGTESKNPGTEYIRGTVYVATDDAMNNIIPVFYSYVTPTFASGSKNSTYSFLRDILDERIKTVMNSSAEEAAKVRLDTSLALNEFYDRNDELVSVLRNEGGFGKVIPKFSEEGEKRSKFSVDILLFKAVRQDEDEEKGLPERMDLEGYIFNYRKDLLPVKLVMYNQKGMDYLDSMDISKSNPLFTKAWGTEITQVIKQETVTENAFGEDEVSYYESSRKVMLVTGMAKEAYEWDDSDFLTGLEVNNMIAERNVMLAEKLADQKKRQANSGNNKSSLKVNNDDDFVF